MSASPAPPLIAIFGPTGVGKTAVAVAVARQLRARGEDPVAVSADALQIYAGLEILTGAADALAEPELEHRLLSIVPVSESFSAGRFAALVHAELDALIAAGRRPILVGGTGLYLRAALTELSLKPPVDPDIRAAIADQLNEHGAGVLHQRLTQQAPQTAERIAPTDAQRITRALELLAAGEDPDPPAGDNELWTTHTRIPTRLFGLTMERDALYERIHARVAAMVAAGAAAEVHRAVRAGAGPSAQKAVGFRELLSGDIAQMQTRTRQYARRQLTWMRKLPEVTLIDLTHISPDAAAARILADGAAR